MADPVKEKSTQKTENTLNMIGQVASLVGPLIFGPEVGIDLGAPFHERAKQLTKKREQAGLMQVLSSDPAMAPLMQQAQGLAESGGLLHQVGQQLGSAASAQSPGLGTVALPQPPQTPQIFYNQAGVPLTNNGGVDVNSPQFTEALAKQGFGDQVFDFLKLQAAKKQDSVDPMQSISDKIQLQLQLKQLQNYQTPAEKQAAELTVSDIKSQNRVEEAKAKLANTDLPTPIQTKLSALEDTNNKLNTFEVQYKQAGLDKIGDSERALDTVISAIGDSTGKMGRLLMQATHPELFNVASTARDLAAAYIRQQSGAQSSEKEYGRLAFVNPTELDKPENMKVLLKNLHLYNRFEQLSLAARNSSRNIEASGFDRAEVERFANVQKMLKSPKADTPEGHALLQAELGALGLDGLLKPPPTTK